MTDTRKLVRTKTPGLYRRGNAWVAVVGVPGGGQQKVYAKTRAEVIALRDELRGDVATGAWRKQARVTFAEYAQQWLPAYAGRTGRGIRPATKADYADALGVTLDGDVVVKGGKRVGAVGYLGQLRLAEVEPRHLKDYAQRLADRGLSQNSVRIALAPVRCMLADAHAEGVIKGNPATALRLPRVQAADDDTKARALTPGQADRLVAETRCPRCDRLPQAQPGCDACDRWQLLVAFMLATALRVGEVSALRWGDVDLGGRLVNVKRRWYRGGFDKPKSRYGVRSVRISKALAQQLWPRQGAADALVFPTVSGSPLDQRNAAARVLKPAGRRAGVPWVTWHVLRHTGITAWFRGGANAAQVQRAAGHHSAAFTLSTYVHLLPTDLFDPDGFAGQDWGNTGASRPAEMGRDDSPAVAVGSA